MKRSLLAVFLLLAGCAVGAPATTSSPAPTAAPTATAAPSAAPAATPTATAGSTAGYTCDPEMSGYGCDTAAPSPGTTPAQTADTVSVSADGAYLVGPNGMSLYVFDNDPVDGNVSMCSTAGCAGAWPALTVASGSAPTAGDGASGTLTTFDRGGVAQVAYNGRPLYFYNGDAAPGDTHGDGISGVWHLAQP